MNRFIRSGFVAAALVLVAPNFALAAQACETAPVVSLVQPGTSAIYVEWTNDVTDVIDFTVTLDQSGSTVDEQNVSADATAATFFGVAVGEDYHVSVTANTDRGSFTSTPSDAVAVIDEYIPIDPPVIETQKLDVSLVTVTLSEDGQSWILSIGAIDQQGERGLYGFVTADGQTCWAYSPAEAVVGDTVSCDISTLEDGSTPEVTAAYYQQDWVMYYARSGVGGIDDVTTTIPGDMGGSEDSSTTVPEGVVETTDVVPTPYQEFVAATTPHEPNTAASIAVLVLGAVAILVLMRPRRVTP